MRGGGDLFANRMKERARRTGEIWRRVMRLLDQECDGRFSTGCWEMNAGLNGAEGAYQREGATNVD